MDIKKWELYIFKNEKDDENGQNEIDHEKLEKIEKTLALIRE